MVLGLRVRRRLLAVAAVPVLLAGSGCDSHETLDPPRPSDAVIAPDGGQIRVVEFGVHMTPVAGLGETNRAVAAVVVENTSKTREAETTRLNLLFLDASGAPVFTFGRTDGYEMALPWIQPGQRLGVGFILASSDKASAGRTVVRMQAEVGQSYWHAPHGKLRVTMSDLHVAQRADGGADLTYVSTVQDLAGANAPSLSFGVYLLLRDATGKLVGGWPLGNRHPLTSRSDGKETFTAEEWKKNVPADADLARSEIYGSYG